MSTKMVVFDVFDTLFANTHDYWRDSFIRVCADQKLGVDPYTLWDLWLPKEREFRARRLNVETMVPGPFESYSDVWFDCFVRAFDELGLKGDATAANELCLADFADRPPFPETLEVIEQFRGKQPMAILSNADDAFLYPLLEKHGITDAFEAIVTSEAAEGYKPHSLIFDVLFKQLGVQPNETLMVGDTLHEDVWGSHLAGMPSAWINRHDALMNGPVVPTHELHSLKDLVTVLKE